MSEKTSALKNALDKHKRARGPASRTQRLNLVPFEVTLMLIKIVRQRSPEGRSIKGPGSATPRGQGDSPKPKPLQVEDLL